MAAKKETRKSFCITAKISITTCIEVYANTFTEAVDLSRGLSIENFVEVIGDQIDSDFGIEGISAFPNTATL
jgi:hypothetical protein